jgi:hypothetical protein
LLIATTLVAIVAATLPWWFPRACYAYFLAGVIVESFRDSPRDDMVSLLTLGVFATVLGVLGWALISAVRR